MPKKLELIYRVLISLCILLLIIGFYLIYSINNISEYPEFERYHIGFYYLSDDNSHVDVSDAQLSYDFDKKLASLTLNPEKNLKKAIIYLPKEYKILSVEKIGVNGGTPVNVTLSLNESTEKRMILIFNDETKEDWINILFKIDLSPNSRFHITTNSFWDSGGHILLKLGNEFKCPRNNCVFNLNNLDFSRLDMNPTKAIRLKFVNQKEDDFSEFEFEITAYSTSLVNKKEFRISLGASIIVGAIFSFFSIILHLYPIGREN